MKQNGFGVVFQTYTAEYEDVTGVYYPNINEMAVDGQENYDLTDGMIYYGYSDVTVTYSFEDYPGITTLENFSVDEQSTPDGYRYSSYADVYAYNAETGDYDMIFKDKSTLSGDELAKYVNGNILILKYEVKDVDMTNYMPRIVARGDE